MYNQQRYQQLQTKSHIRGKLNKQFYYKQQEQLQKKRKEMKMILDKQIEQKKKQKQKQKFTENLYHQQQEQKIKAYQILLENRQKTHFNLSINNSRTNHQQLHSNSAQGIYPHTIKNNSSGIYDSRVSAENNNITIDKNKHRSRSRPQFQYDSGDIPVMPLLKNTENKPLNQQNQSHHQPQYQQFKPNQKIQNNMIPYLQFQPDQKKKKRKIQGGPDKKYDKYFIQKNYKDKKIIFIQNTTHQQSNSRQKTQLKDLFNDINQQLQQQNKQLKKQLKKKQQAISLLLGAVKSNGKFDKFRIQVQKILHGQNTLDNKILPITQIQSGSRRLSTREGRERNRDERESMLPKLKLRNQSIMHDYMFGSAKKAYQLKSKTFK